MPTEDIETFLAIARNYLSNAYTKIALQSLPPSKEAELWSLIHGVEAAMRMRGASLNAELEQIDRELERRFRRNPTPVR